MRYLVIDAAMSGTGIRNKYEGGYINPEDLSLSLAIRQRLNAWLSKYENEHYNNFADDNIINELDQEGKEIALMIKSELMVVKIEYFSDARLTTEII
ncbi:hypothetical protein [Moheibacter sediminis]|uniref:Uncharacterized protein n=1 Tax=Moheibacter sediminis TaxID=1434700 RepID=A0A1W1ZKH6_9FLAO|nr:hypothetical protein [Moheibacter sediminis]SMC48743.1 hypothetical protein SAMN06296427_10311 [Moheibacter sediminis]